MSSKSRKPKKKAQERPWYTKYEGYMLMEGILRDTKRQLIEVGSHLNIVSQADRSELLVGEVQQLEAVDTKVRAAIPEIVTKYNEISKKLKDFVQVKRELDDLDFRPLVMEGMEFLEMVTEKVVVPVSSTEEIISAAIARNKKQDLEHESA